MGFAKQQQIREWERGWQSAGFKHVCAECFSDYALKAFVSCNADSRHCDYCSRTSASRPIAAPIDEVLDLINRSLLTEWGHPDDEGIPYESREGGYQFSVADIYDLFDDEVGYAFTNDSVRDEVIEAFEGQLWCQRNFYRLPPDIALTSAWSEFCELIRHKNRYLFTVTPEQDTRLPDPDYIAPAAMLTQIGRMALDLGLVRTMPAGTTIYRARLHPSDQGLDSAADLGPPPLERAIYSNRMSPAGIPMFYGSLDAAVAIDEVCYGDQTKDRMVTVGTFVTERRFPIVDFSNIPSVPSLFDDEHRQDRFPLAFLHGFTADLSKPIDKDGREHIDYVPTQVVTEYFRHIFEIEHDIKVRGIIYQSSRVLNGRNCVFFFEATGSRDFSFEGENDWGIWLTLVQKSVHTP